MPLQGLGTFVRRRNVACPRRSSKAGDATKVHRPGGLEKTVDDLRLGRAENNTRLAFALGLRSPAHGILQRNRNLGTVDLDRSEVIPQSAVLDHVAQLVVHRCAVRHRHGEDRHR